MQLVFIHGSGGCKESWKHQTNYFPNSVAVNLPGHPEGNLCRTIPEYVTWLHEYIQNKGFRDVVLAGHSLGGGIALQYALDYPEDVAGLISIGSGGRLRVHPDFLNMLEKAITDPSFLETFSKGTYDLIEPKLASVIKQRAAENTPQAFLNDLKACDRFDILDRLDAITQPVLAIAGDKDVMTPPKYSHFMADKIEGARVVVIPGGTHFVFAEKPEAVNRVIEDFILSL